MSSPLGQVTPALTPLNVPLAGPVMVTNGAPSAPASSGWTGVMGFLGGFALLFLIVWVILFTWPPSWVLTGADRTQVSRPALFGYSILIALILTIIFALIGWLIKGSLRC